MTQTRADRADQLGRAELKTTLIELVSQRYRTIDRGRLNPADLQGLSRADLIDLILKAEYPEGTS